MKISRVFEVSIGAIVVIVAAVLGSYLTATYSYEYQKTLNEMQLSTQKELLDKQFAFQKELLEQQKAFTMKMYSKSKFDQRVRDSIRGR